jgi:hypothetical protein
MGATRAKELRQMADLGYRLRRVPIDKKAVGSNGLLPGSFHDIDGNPRMMSYSFIAKLIDAGNDRKTAFISNVRGGNLIRSGPHKGKAGCVIQFSPFLFARGNKQAEPAKYQYFTGWSSSHYKHYQLDYYSYYYNTQQSTRGGRGSDGWRDGIQIV